MPCSCFRVPFLVSRSQTSNACRAGTTPCGISEGEGDVAATWIDRRPVQPAQHARPWQTPLGIGRCVHQCELPTRPPQNDALTGNRQDSQPGLEDCGAGSRVDHPCPSNDQPERPSGGRVDVPVARKRSRRRDRGSVEPDASKRAVRSIYRTPNPEGARVLTGRDLRPRPQVGRRLRKGPVCRIDGRVVSPQYDDEGGAARHSHDPENPAPGDERWNASDRCRGSAIDIEKKGRVAGDNQVQLRPARKWRTPERSWVARSLQGRLGSGANRWTKGGECAA